jgi:cyclase
MSSKSLSLIPRVIPVLLIQNRGSLVKSVKFKDHIYVGDPLNAVKIFNEKEVDELILLDISASKESREPDYRYIEQLATECFMPVTYGGGITTAEQCRRIIGCGIEKVSINTGALNQLSLVKEAAEQLGSSSVVVTIDVKKDSFGKRKVFRHDGKKVMQSDPVAWARKAAEWGAGEILFQSVDRDGTMQGYDIDLLSAISAAVNVPVIACGGAGEQKHFAEAFAAGASAVAAGSRFVFFGKHRAILINYLTQDEIVSLTRQ